MKNVVLGLLLISLCINLALGAVGALTFYDDISNTGSTPDGPVSFGGMLNLEVLLSLYYFIFFVSQRYQIYIFIPNHSH